jgi:hypothetical protein
MDHHMAATFLLLGWYLMVPPLVDREGELKPDPRARLSDWQHIDSYVSAGRAGMELMIICKE